jgi:hypothetical protein
VGVDVLAVNREPDPARISGEEQQRAELREGVSAPPVALALVDELRVEPEGNVVHEEPVADAADVDPLLRPFEGVQCLDRIVRLEPEVAREVVPGAVRDADEWQAALERGLRDRRE